MLDSFQNTLNGLRHALRNERWFRAEVAFVAVGAPLALAVADDPMMWALLVGSLALVAAFELVNTALEAVCDEISEAPREGLGVAKDSASAAVWLAKLIAMLLWTAAIVALLR